jgi:ribosomal RNA assembly protein
MPSFLAIPKERVAVLVGTDGRTKRLIEKRCQVELTIAPDGQVSIFEKKGGDALLAYKARDLVKAIGRGFSPEKALELLEDGVSFFLLDLGDFAPNEKAATRLKSRIIGAGGRCRRVFETTLGIYMSVYGDTVGLIGPDDAVAIAREGLEKLLAGSMHATVYKLIDKKKRDTGTDQWWQSERKE